MGVFSEKSLIIELIGFKANIILTDDSKIIIDCLRRVGGDIDGKRMTLPGLLYHPPPLQAGKVDSLEISYEHWLTLFKNASENTVSNWLLSNFAGFSPLICRELSWRAYGDTETRFDSITDGGEALNKEFFEIVADIRAGKFEPVMLIDDKDIPSEFSYRKIFQYESALTMQIESSFSEMLDSFYTRRAQENRVKQRASATVKSVKIARDRIARKLVAQIEELNKTVDREYLRECGDIITANLHNMSKGQKILEAEDFYSESGGQRKIPLDQLKTPQQNAAKYYKKYTKAKNAEKFLAEQIKHGEKEHEYLESVLEALSLAEGERDLNEIRGELVQTGYLKSQKKSKGKSEQSSFLTFTSSLGFRIFVGKNNVQNDKLTLKTAMRGDIWLHTQKIHGSHVIISCAGVEPDEVTLNEAAQIAAYYSAARQSSNVPVDYTLVKNVKKPSGGRPGMVIYVNYKTLYVTPDEAQISKLRD
jgi:predicted ribosome quality control (RQC) complex YloA/Tae2 family protein